MYPSLETAIIRAYLKQIAACPDSLIWRKCGPDTANEASTRAANVLNENKERPDLNPSAVADFDRWLRADGHRRNPGTTADLVAAALFVLLREGRLNWSEW
jgi:triphosphoribosyl-dephospho-CoA synthase